MTTEGGRDDAVTARSRCLQAIAGADFETQRSLWRAALRYNERIKVERSGGLEISTQPLPRAAGEIARDGVR